MAHPFRSLKTVLLKVRPIFNWRERRVRAHPLLCMLAYYLEFHMRRLAPLLFAGEGGPAPGASPLAPLEWSPEAKRNDRTREMLDGARKESELKMSLSEQNAVLPTDCARKAPTKQYASYLLISFRGPLIRTRKFAIL